MRKRNRVSVIVLSLLLAAGSMNPMAARAFAADGGTGEVIDVPVEEVFSDESEERDDQEEGFSDETVETGAQEEAFSDESVGADGQEEAFSDESVEGDDQKEAFSNNAESTSRQEEDAVADTVDPGQETAATEAVYASSTIPSQGKILYSGNSGDMKWTIDENGLLTVKGTGEFEMGDIGHFHDKPDGEEYFSRDLLFGWNKYADQIRYAEIQVRGCTSICGLLGELKNLQAVTFEGSDTSKVLDFCCLFASEESNRLESLDLRCLDTHSAISMGQMFYGCTMLKTVDLRGWDTSQVIDMTSMFDNCHSLTAIQGIEDLDVHNLRYMDIMFQMAHALTSLDLSRWATVNLRSMWWAFSTCEQLTGSMRILSDPDNVEAVFRYSLDQSEGDFTLLYSDNSSSLQTMQAIRDSADSNSDKIRFSRIEEENGHEWSSWEVTKNATEEEEGTSERFCSVCGKKERKTIAKAIPASSVSINRKSAEVPAAGSIQLSAKVLPDNTTDKTVAWYSSDPSIATVDENGLVKGKKYGTAVITAQTVNDRTAECRIQVRFADVANSGKSYFKPVYWAVDSGITVVTVNFRPEDPVTRGEFVAFLWRLDGKPRSSAKVNFKDVNARTKFYDAIRWAVGQGIIKGYSDGTFKSDRNVTRGETATMLWRYAGKPNPETKKSPFSDLKASNTDSYKAILWGAENGIIKGSKGKFLKNDGCTRGQVVTFLYRYGN